MKRSAGCDSLKRQVAIVLTTVSTMFLAGCGGPPVEPVPITQPWSDMALPIGDAIVWGSSHSELKVLYQGALYEVAGKYVDYFENDGWTTTRRESTEHAYDYGFQKGGEDFEVLVYTFDDVGVIIKRKSQTAELAFAVKTSHPTDSPHTNGNTNKEQPVPPPSPTAQLGANESLLRDLAPTSAEVLSGNDHLMDRKFTIQKITFESGIYIHPPAPNSTGRVSYDLNGTYARLAGRVGVCDHVFRQSSTPLTFRILGDGKELWKSQPLKQCGDWVAFDVNMTSVNSLTLEVICSGDHTGAHGGWMDPVLTAGLD